MTFVRSSVFFAVFGMLFASIFFVFPRSVHAQVSYADIQSQGIIFAGICPSRTAECACRDNGDCTLDDILQVFVNIATFILGISGSIVLLMFVYGGFVWITAQGNQDRVKTGKDVLVGSVIGLVIIFGAYAAINVLISVLKTGELPSSDQNLEDTIGSPASGVLETSP